MQYKLLALDIDDTTLCRDGTLSVKNAEAIKRINQNGGYVVIITGRSPKATYPVWRMINAHAICSCFGGATVVDMEKNECIYTTEIESALVTEALEFAHSLGLVSQIYVGDDVMTEYENAYTERYGDYLKLKCIAEPNIRRMKHIGVPEILCFVHEEEQAHIMEKFQEKFDGRLQISASAKYFIELSNIASDKGEGLRMICEALGVDIGQTVAMGDSLLDVPMIKKAAVGVAVANASNDVKNCADFISVDCDNDAVAQVAKLYFNC